ncbi:MAG TPA: cob(I)yrinic acid a,c-diamide adenosyltransferase [bacterium]|nr:cob(I)yrinic acid a,c-diamide adenosyltransferase [bacterium]
MSAKNNKIKKPAGLVIVYTGEGKGKTTAAIGLAIRAAGWGKKIAVIQFIKGYKEIGEWKFLESIKQIDIYQTHDSKIASIGLPNNQHKSSCLKSLKMLKTLINKDEHDVLILDEINNAISYDLVEAGEIIKILNDRPVRQTVILTGRNAPEEILEIADLVTEMKNIKHPYDIGIQAKRGIDY